MHDVEGLGFALPPGVVEKGRKRDQGDLFARYDDGDDGGEALVIVVVRTGAQLPFEVLDDGQTAKASSTLGVEPAIGPEASWPQEEVDALMGSLSVQGSA